MRPPARRVVPPLLLMALGAAIVGRTVALGVGGGLGLLIGGLMIVGAGLRLYMVTAWRRS